MSEVDKQLNLLGLEGGMDAIHVEGAIALGRLKRVGTIDGCHPGHSRCEQEDTQIDPLGTCARFWRLCSKWEASGSMKLEAEQEPEVEGTACSGPGAVTCDAVKRAFIGVRLQTMRGLTRDQFTGWKSLAVLVVLLFVKLSLITGISDEKGLVSPVAEQVSETEGSVSGAVSVSVDAVDNELAGGGVLLDSTMKKRLGIRVREAFIKLASEGDLNAAFELFLGCLEGRWDDWSDKEAEEWLQKAAELGHANAQYLYAVSWQHPVRLGGVFEDKAAKWFSISSENGNANADVGLGLLAQQPASGEPDHAKALFYFRQASSRGNRIGDALVGMCYELGLGTAMNLKEAEHFYRRAIDGGFDNNPFALPGMPLSQEEAAIEALANAATSLGTFVLNRSEPGLKETAEVKEALAMYKMGAEAGLDEAAFLLGVLFQKGGQVEKDERVAFGWLKKAASVGHVESQFLLGWNYEHGVGVAQSDGNAMDWYNRAANQGHVRSLVNLAFMLREQKDYGLAYKCFESAARMGDHKSFLVIGDFYKEGLGLEKDAVQAYKWYYLAYRLNEAGAQSLLNAMAESMTPVQLVEAIRLAAQFIRQVRAKGSFDMLVMPPEFDQANSLTY